MCRYIGNGIIKMSPNLLVGKNWFLAEQKPATFKTGRLHSNNKQKDHINFCSV